MAELIVVGFKQDMHRASEVLNTLQEMNDSWVVDLNDGVAVYRDYKGRLRVDESYRMAAGQGATWGALVGGLIGALVRLPDRDFCGQRYARIGIAEILLRHACRVREYVPSNALRHADIDEVTNDADGDRSGTDIGGSRAWTLGMLHRRDLARETLIF